MWMDTPYYIKFGFYICSSHFMMVHSFHITGYEFSCISVHDKLWMEWCQGWGGLNFVSLFFLFPIFLCQYFIQGQ